MTSHALGVADLPPFHDDPFDRLLISQARHERAVLMTADPQILRYDIETVWAGRDAPPPPPRQTTKRPKARR